MTRAGTGSRTATRDREREKNREREKWRETKREAKRDEGRKRRQTVTRTEQRIITKSSVGEEKRLLKTCPTKGTDLICLGISYFSRPEIQVRRH